MDSGPTVRKSIRERSREDSDPSCWSCTGLCKGRAGPVWFFLSPFVLIYNALTAFCFPCVKILAIRCFRCVCYPFIKCCGTWVFEDDTFCGATAIGEDKEGVEWVRAKELFPNRKGPMQLFEGEIEPADLCQGAVGDCWLVAALASASEHPESIRTCFLTPEYNPRGKYSVRLWDGQAGKFVIITVDDRIPCEKDSAGRLRPIYMKANGYELWAIILEKAFAKFCGSYAQLDGGHTQWAWRAMTGDHTFRLLRNEKSNLWDLAVMYNVPDVHDKRAIKSETSAGKYTDDEVWVLIQRYLEAKSLISTSFHTGVREEKDSQGLVAGHAYSILRAVEIGIKDDTRLVQLRNPWGEFEWKGAWADGSKEWKENPVTRMRLRPKDEDDGSFWMPYDDFFKTFGKVEVCDRTTDRDLALHPKEEYATCGCGVCLGCVAGCGAFWFGCRGPRVIYGGHVSSAKTRSAERGCCGRV
mmetsp:Transcript_67952/g.214927  ORF Transcript_67952/g.214927 Transcript_67952/m.214927 type:complete len:469 (+) Transcript_67952:211-1617(+)